MRQSAFIRLVGRRTDSVVEQRSSLSVWVDDRDTYYVQIMVNSESIVLNKEQTAEVVQVLLGIERE